MSNLENFAAYAAAFEKTLVDDNWQRLDQYFCSDARYLPGDGSEAIGSTAAIAALRNSVEQLERKTDTRELVSGPEISESGNTITLEYGLKYTRQGSPDFVLVGTETIDYVDGSISRMEDVFDQADAFHQWRNQL